MEWDLNVESKVRKNNSKREMNFKTEEQETKEKTGERRKKQL